MAKSRGLLQSMKRHRSLLKRAVAFLAIIYLVMPFIFSYIEYRYIPIKMDFFFFSVFSLMIIGLFAAFSRTEILRYRFKFSYKEMISSALLAIISFLFFLKFNLLTENINLIRVSFLIFIFFFILTAIAAFGLNFLKIFLKPIGAAFFLAYIYISGVIIGTIFVRWEIGDFFAILTTRIASFFLKIFNLPSEVIISDIGSPVLSGGSFTARIEPFCSGVESLVLFLGVAIFVAVYDRKKIEWKRGLLLLVLGLAGAYCINILRVLLLILIGRESPALAITLFHNNLGWMMFVVYTLLLLFFAYPKVLKK